MHNLITSVHLMIYICFIKLYIKLINNLINLIHLKTFFCCSMKMTSLFFY